MFDRIHPTQWIMLPADIREQIAKDFGMFKTGVSEIRDQYLVSDGRTMEDLAAINAEAMSAYVGSEEPFARLWELTVAKAKSILNPPVGVIMSHEATEQLPPVEVIKAKHAKKIK